MGVVTKAYFAEALAPLYRETFLQHFLDLERGHLLLAGGKARKATRRENIMWAAKMMLWEEQYRRYQEKIEALKRGESVSLTAWERQELENDMSRADDY